MTGEFFELAAKQKSLVLKQKKQKIGVNEPQGLRPDVFQRVLCPMLLLDFDEELLGVTPDLGAAPGGYVRLQLLPVLPSQFQA